MCGRFTLTWNEWRQVVDAHGAVSSPRTASTNGPVRRPRASRYGSIRSAGGLMLFAGLYETWYRERNQPEVTFTIVTCPASAAIAEIHDGMPVVLDERAADDWMNPRERDPLSLKRLLVPAPRDVFAMRPASPLVNSVKNEGPTLLDFSEAATPDLFSS